MAQAITFSSATFLDASSVEMKATSSANRKTLEEWGSGINNTNYHTLGSSSSVLMRLANNTVLFAFICSPSAGVSGIYAVGCTSGGTAYFQELVPGSDIAMTRSAGNVRFTNNNTGNAGTMMVIVCRGSYTAE